MNQTSPGGSPVSLPRLAAALVVGWLLPGLGHILIRERTRGLVLLVTIAVTFWTGVAVGGIRATVNPGERKLWFAAQLGAGGHTLLAWAGHEIAKSGREITAQAKVPVHWRSLDIAIHYTGVAGLLNVLVLLDALGRADASRRVVAFERTLGRGTSP